VRKRIAVHVRIGFGNGCHLYACGSFAPARLERPCVDELALKKRQDGADKVDPLGAVTCKKCRRLYEGAAVSAEGKRDA
jgi:hypothetical protein